MTPEELIARATDPRQYDHPDMDWPLQGAPGTPTARYYQQVLREALSGMRPRAALDIGCGTGHLEPLLRELGATRVAGIEPASRNVAVARRAFPALELIEGSLAGASLPGGFDLALAVMSFEHQPDLRAAFRSVARLLAPGGAFVLITGDPEFHRTPRFDLRLEVRELADCSTVVATGYPFGTIHDIIRPPALVLAAAAAEGFTLERRVALRPTAVLIETDPRWRELMDRAHGHLFVLRRN